MDNNKILVTGATGFLGQRLALELKNKGYLVTAVGRNQLIGNSLQKSGISFINTDLTDKERTLALGVNQDIIIHCAALSSPWGRYQDFFAANVLATRHIVDSCLKHQVKRLIHISTPSIYFNYTDRFNIKESDPLPKTMVNHYAQTKLLAEQEVEAGILQNLAAIIIRPRGIFGPGDTALFPRIIKANNKLGIPLIDGGNNLVDLTYVDNVVDALIAAIDSPPESLGRKYNISNGAPVKMIDVLTKIFQLLDIPCRFRPTSFAKIYNLARILELIHKTILFGKEPVLTKYTAGIMAKNMTLNTDLAQKYLNFQPKINIETGLENFVNWYKQDDHKIN